MYRASALLVVALTCATPAAAQPLFELELGGGFTLVDVEGVAAEDGAIAEDWSQPSYRIAGRALFGSPEGRRYGVEIGHQHLYWYSVRIPFGSTPIRREYGVTATTAMGLLRLDTGSAVIDFGAGLAFLDDPAPTLSVAAGWRIADRFAVKVRADGMIAAEPTLPFGVGFSYAFRPASR